MNEDAFIEKKPVYKTPADRKQNKQSIPKKEAWIRTLLKAVRNKFSKVKDTGKDRRKKLEKKESQQIASNNDSRKIIKRLPIVDCLMSGLAVFGMKCSSLLQFESRKKEEAIKHNLETLYQVKNVPSDTYLRERLDEVDPNEIRGAFKTIFSIIQRNKKLEDYNYLEEGYICSIDGTGYFSSNKVHCGNCCIKKHSNGSFTYYHQSFQGAIVHPEKNGVIPFCPEAILKEDGNEKNDCELNAAKRMIKDLRREHPHLKLVITADAIGANGPYIQTILDNKMSFVIVVKESGNKSLFDFINGLELGKHEFIKDEINYSFSFINNVPLNDTYKDLLVNYFEYEETNIKTGEKKQCSWITNIKVTIKNVFKLMKAGRSKWKIENENFNTLKNQGYSFEHNFGHGNKNLTSIMAMLMVLAFLLDQAQELLCTYFQNALKKAGRKIRLWEKMIELFKAYLILSWEDFYLAISGKHIVSTLTIDSS
jgi:hypothetical protein